uniref:Uncharacterized protein n=1 Tax=Romanomermis culicivorax TaxID=13658 RepID=A0A915JWX5_ROMCU
MLPIDRVCESLDQVKAKCVQIGNLRNSLNLQGVPFKAKFSPFVRKTRSSMSPFFVISLS